jgi:tetratricopeptide (TPR) repeat protein
MKKGIPNNKKKRKTHENTQKYVKIRENKTQKDQSTMASLFSFLKIVLSLSLILLAVHFGGSITINSGGKSVDIHIAAVVLGCILLMYLYGFVASLLKKILSFFSGKPKHEKGIENLQLAFSGILLKDKRLAERCIGKAKKYLGNIPLVSWIEGQLMLINRDHHRAKALFYELCGREKNTALGAYSLSKMAVNERSEVDALNAINAVLKISSDSTDLVFQAITISLRNMNFTEAKKHIPSIKKTKKGRLVEAIIYAEEGFANKDIDLMQKAFKLAPELHKNAIHYADLLLKNHEYKKARNVLLQSFRRTQSIELIKKYVSCGKNLSDSDRARFVEKIIDEVPESWVGYFEFANISMENDMKQIAFQNFLKAYEKGPYDFVAEKLLESAKMLDDPAQRAAADDLISSLACKKVDFVWRCGNCGNEENDWIAICKHCDRIGEYALTERAMPNPVIKYPNIIIA